MKQRHPIIRGTLILTSAGLLSRFIGFFYRIFLSQTIGAEGMGIYQLIFPVYTFCFALTVFGIQTAISRFCAAQSALGNLQKSNDSFLLGTLLSVSLSCIIARILQHNAAWISLHLLGEARCTPLLRLLSCCLPPGAVHTCVNAYYYARKKAEVPAISQLLEQLIRVGASYLVYLILLFEGATVNAIVAVVGILVGELASMIYSLLTISLSLHRQNYRLSRMEAPFKSLKDILSMSLPLTGHRMLLTLLTSAEHVMIPNRLRLYGLSVSDALSLFGILSGMVMPLLLFPATITNSISVMLLPTVAQQQALGNQQKIQSTIRLTVRGCLAMGVGCMFFFFLSGNFLGNWLFHTETVGMFLRALAFACPFIYLNSTLMGILNGLGKTGSYLLHNLTALSIRIAFAYLCLPRFGIKGYLWGILVSELTLTALNLRLLASLTRSS